MKKLNKKEFSKNFIKTFFENFNIKIVCFILAIATYIAIGFFQRNEKTFLCRLNVIGLNESYTISNEIPEYVRIIAKDKQKVIDKLTESDFNVKLDLSNSNLSEQNNTNVKIEWNIPKSMNSLFSSVEINPDTIPVKIEKLIEKNVPVVVNYTGSIEKGFSIKKTTIDPLEIRIQGAEQLLNKIKFIETEKININGINESFKREANLISPNNTVKIIGKTKVDVFFELEKESNFITYKFDNIYFSNLKPQFRAWLERTPIYIKVTGEKTELDNLSQDSIFLSADCSGILIPGIYNIKIDVKLPKNIELSSEIPETFKIHIEDKRY